VLFEFIPSGVLPLAVCRFTGEPTPIAPAAANFAIYRETHRKRSWIEDQVSCNAANLEPESPAGAFLSLTKRA